MGQPESARNLHRHIRRGNIWNITDLQLDVAELREQTLTPDQNRELWFITVGVIFGILGKLKACLELEFFTFSQLFHTPRNTTLSAIPYSASRLSGQRFTQNVFGYSHNDGQVYQLGFVIGIGTDLQSHATVCVVEFDSSLHALMKATRNSTFEKN